jgi:hypothetical protein
MSEADLSQQAASHRRQTREEGQQAREQAQKEHNDKLMFRVTLASTVVAVIAAIAALWSGYEAHQTRVSDERPFLAVDFKQDDSGTSSNPDSLFPAFQMSLVAFGKTPAKQVQVRCEMQIDNEKKMVWDNGYGYKKFSFPYILPSRSVLIFCPLKDWPDSQKGDIRNYVILGVAKYEDETKREYLTPFCEEIFTLYRKIQRMGPCERDVKLPELK